MSELLKQEKLTKRQTGYTNDIYESARSLLGIVNDILDFSKIESGKLEINPVDYDFKAFIDNVGSMFSYVAGRKGLEFRFETEGEMPQYLYGDDIKLRQALTNICGNAVKFTDNGYVRLKITALFDKLIFEIKDTGRGISKEEAPKLFSAFQQADRSKNRKTTGTGLGLVISKSFVEMMGGSISFDSEYGEGTVFTIIIPAIPGEKSRVQNEKKDKEQLTIFAPEADILVVDDNEFNLRAACGVLSLFKINADSAESGMEALELVKKRNYDIIFMDHMMPEMDGIETTTAIRRLGGAFTETPIIALTANAVQGAREMFLANGFSDFISKPIDMRILNGMLSAWLPPGKIKNASDYDPSEEALDADSPGYRLVLDSIDEIDIEIGLSRFSGVESIYHDSLAFFTKMIRSECGHMAGFINENDTHGFAIRVHAMKSKLSSIGAMSLSETAARLEIAAKNGESVYCSEHYPALEAELLALHKKLSFIFPDADDEVIKKPGNAAYLIECLPRALAAADDLNNEACVHIIGGLIAYDFGEKINAELWAALTAVKKYDYERVEELLRGITAPSP